MNVAFSVRPGLDPYPRPGLDPLQETLFWIRVAKRIRPGLDPYPRPGLDPDPLQETLIWIRVAKRKSLSTRKQNIKIMEYNIFKKKSLLFN